MELQGKIKLIAPIEMRGANNDFKTRKLMLDRSSTYEGNTRVNFTEITLLGDKSDIPEQKELKPGDFIKVQFNVKGRFFQHEGKEKFAQDVEVWQIDVVAKGRSTETSQHPGTDGAPY